MTPIESIPPSEAKRSERASDERRRSREEMIARDTDKPYALPNRAHPPRTDGRATDVEIAYCEKLLRDLAGGMRNLRALEPEPYDIRDRIVAQAAKIRTVEMKLFKLRQGRLL